MPPQEPDISSLMATLPVKKKPVQEPNADDLMATLPVKKETTPAPEQPSLARRFWNWGQSGLAGHEPTMEEWQRDPKYAADQARLYYLTSPFAIAGEALPVLGGIKAIRALRGASKAAEGVAEIGNIAHEVAPEAKAAEGLSEEAFNAAQAPPVGNPAKPPLIKNADGTFTNPVTNETTLTEPGTGPAPVGPAKPTNWKTVPKPLPEEVANAQEFFGVNEEGKPLSQKRRGRPPKAKPEVGPNAVTDEKLKQILEDPTISPLQKKDSIKKWEAFTGKKYNGPNLPPEPPPPPTGGTGGPPPEGEDPRYLTQLINTPKALWATMDMSAPLRQGFPLMFSQPKEFFGALPGMVKSFASEGKYGELMQSIIDHPNYKRAIDDGLQITNLQKLSTREENFMAPILDKWIPGVRRSNRAYTAFLDKLRMDTYNSLISTAEKTPGLNVAKDKTLTKGIAEFINNATGRGNLGKFEQAASDLNNILFSPRLIASRLQMMNPVNYVAAPAFVRKQYWKAMAGSIAAWTTFAGLAKLGGAEINMSPTNSDFGKIKIGNTRIDPGAGFLQYIVATTRLGQMPLQYAFGRQGTTTSSLTGRTKRLNTGRFGEPTYFDIGERFIESKLSPIMQAAVAMAHGTDYAGNKISVPSETIDLFVPLIIQDMIETYNTDPDLVPWVGIPSFFGMGIQSYGKTEGDISAGKIGSEWIRRKLGTEYQ